jgi:hypothetical protein
MTTIRLTANDEHRLVAVAIFGLVVGAFIGTYLGGLV